MATIFSKEQIIKRVPKSKWAVFLGNDRELGVALPSEEGSKAWIEEKEPTNHKMKWVDSKTKTSINNIQDFRRPKDQTEILELMTPELQERLSLELLTDL